VHYSMVMHMPSLLVAIKLGYDQLRHRILTVPGEERGSPAKRGSHVRGQTTNF